MPDILSIDLRERYITVSRRAPGRPRTASASVDDDILVPPHAATPPTTAADRAELAHAPVFHRRGHRRAVAVSRASVSTIWFRSSTATLVSSGPASSRARIGLPKIGLLDQLATTPPATSSTTGVDRPPTPRRRAPRLSRLRGVFSSVRVWHSAPARLPQQPIRLPAPSARSGAALSRRTSSVHTADGQIRSADPAPRTGPAGQPAVRRNEHGPVPSTSASRENDADHDTAG